MISMQRQSLRNAKGRYQVASPGGHQMRANWPLGVCVCVTCTYIPYNAVMMNTGSTSLDLSRVLHGQKWLPWVTSPLVGQNLRSTQLVLAEVEKP